MSFVARPATDPTPAETDIGNDGFFPDIAPATLRETLRVTEAVTPARWREALCGAILSVGRDLEAWQAEQVALGFDTMADVPAPELDGQSRLLFLYIRAVSCLARAEVTERLRDFDLTPSGKRDLGRSTSDEPCSVDDWRRDARYAVRDILGRSRTTIELI